MAGVKQHQGEILSAKQPRGGDRLLSQGQTPSGALEGTMCGGESGIAEVTARMGLSLQDLKASRSLDQLVQNKSHMVRGAPFCFVFCLFGGNLFT